MDELVRLLKEIYPVSYNEIISELNSTIKVKEKDSSVEDDWYKQLNIYVAYPNAFEKDGKYNLFTLAEKIEYIKNLGFNALHILPFLDSPMIDGGFDVKNFLGVRISLGGMNGIESVISQCTKNDVKTFMDLVINHVSDQHEWFQKALAGEEKYRDYFINQKIKPKLVRRFQDEKGHWAEYDFGKRKVNIRIIFPQFEKELPHWVQGKDGYWYYHTFYQYQPDLNWYNPQVFIEFIEILKYWALKGMSFRLDAITFIGKDLQSGIIESNPNLHLIIKALSIVLRFINPDSVFLAEAGQPLFKIKQYFGEESKPETHLAYNFNLMQAIWYSYLSHDPRLIKEVLDESFANLPNHAAWVSFLRNHDELTLEFTKKEVRRFIYKNLIAKGMDFRNGFGISGRTMNLVDMDVENLIFIYKILASLPGPIALIYGDELGKINDTKFMEDQIKYESEILKLENVDIDTRDINRGIITLSEINNEKGQLTYFQFSNIFNKRLSLINFFKNKPVTSVHKSILNLQYNCGGLVLNIKIDFKNRICEWS